MSEFHSIKWLDPYTATRKTAEVDLICRINKNTVFKKNGEFVKGWGITLEGSADDEHHLVEDANILLRKIAETKCGGGH